MMRKLRVLLVDDERLARKDLRRMLSDIPSVEVVGEADSVAGALKLVGRDDPDLVFLDIQMPGESGFDLLEGTDLRAKVVFVTAFDEYAIRAFEVAAVDYLLKPVLPARLAAAVERIRRDEPPAAGPGGKLRSDDAILVSLNSHLKFVRVSNILSIHAAGDYSELTTSDGKKGLVQKTMVEWEERLPPNHFCRIHRSTIVNIERIQTIEEKENGTFLVHVNGLEQPLVMSRRSASTLKHTMK